LLQLRGSGKTAVLVERIVNKIINENIDIDRLLVVTFTNAAASEMRERILNKIYEKIEESEENGFLQRQVTLLNKASICTIDSFCLDVVKNNFYELDISPNFRIGDNAEIELLKQEVLEELFEEKYEQEDEDFIKLIHTYTNYRDDTPLKDLMLKIYTYIQSNPYPNKWLEEKIEMFNLKDKLEEDFASTVWGKLLIKELEEELTDCISILNEQKKIVARFPELDSYVLCFADDIDKIECLKNNLDNWDKAYEIANNLKFAIWPKSKENLEAKENAKKVRDAVKKKLEKKIDKIMIYNSKEANQDIYDMHQVLVILKNVIFDFDKLFKKKKAEKNIVDFNDIEHFALEILSKEEVAKKYQEKFIEIAIDEYQDSNLVQEYILTSISKGNNIFMVGDVKQSIYKFRQARPKLFLDKYYTYKLKNEKNESDDLKIKLFKNFRSRENVLSFTNMIFENIMNSSMENIDYTEEEFLNLGANYPVTLQDLKTEINIIDLAKNKNLSVENQENGEVESNENLKKASLEQSSDNDADLDTDSQEKLENIEIEAKFVASRIEELVKDKFQVFDNKKQEFRNIKYKDIVVLLRSTKLSAPIYEKEMIAKNIPVFSDSSSESLETIEIQTIMAILKIIDNPLNDISLVIVLRSVIGGFTDDDLVKIRLTDKYDNFYNTLIKSKLNVDDALKTKIEKILDSLDMWRKEQEYLSLDELIWKIYTDTGYYNYVGLMPNGALRQANLKMLFEKAKQYEKASFKGLFNFIHFIEKLSIGSGDFGSAKLIGENEDVVRIMSIHKSKGLEFPVVILANTGKEINLMDLKENVLLHQDIGIGAKYIDYDRQIEYDTLSKTAIKNQLLVENLSEEMRILYVALTRAKEKIIITGISKDYEKEKGKMQELVDRYERDGKKINPILIKKYKKYLDWIRLVLMYENDENINLISGEDIIKSDKESKLDENNDKNPIAKKLENREINEQNLEKIKEILESKYKYEASIKIPNKTSVTKIKQMKIDKKVNLSNIFIDEKSSKIENDELENTLKINSFAKPKFLNNQEEKITSAQKGTLIHLCMQKLNCKKAYTVQDVKDLITDLKIRKIITEEESNVINATKIFKFTKSNIWNELQTAREVQKEKPFYIEINSSEIFEDESNEKVLVQGIIDLYYIDKDGNIVLVDYKTDYVENEMDLVEKYKEQLLLYKRALESALKKQVDRVYIYSTYLDKEILFTDIL
jgi:ATP-dependent helicase/nuclease subunit A